MKRIISILVAAALCVAGLACGAPLPSGDDTEGERVAEAEQAWWSEEFLEGLETAVKNTRFVCIGSSSAGPAPKLIVWALNTDEAEGKAIGIWAASHYTVVDPDDAFCTSGSFDPAPTENASPGPLVPGMDPTLPGYVDPDVKWRCSERFIGYIGGVPLVFELHDQIIWAKVVTFVPGQSAIEKYTKWHFDEYGMWVGHTPYSWWDCDRVTDLTDPALP